MNACNLCDTNQHGTRSTRTKAALLGRGSAPPGARRNQSAPRLQPRRGNFPLRLPSVATSFGGEWAGNGHYALGACSGLAPTLLLGRFGISIGQLGGELVLSSPHPF